MTAGQFCSSHALSSEREKLHPKLCIYSLGPCCSNSVLTNPLMLSTYQVGLPVTTNRTSATANSTSLQGTQARQADTSALSSAWKCTPVLPTAFYHLKPTAPRRTCDGSSLKNLTDGSTAAQQCTLCGLYIYLNALLQGLHAFLARQSALHSTCLL